MYEALNAKRLAVYCSQQSVWQGKQYPMGI